MNDRRFSFLSAEWRNLILAQYSPPCDVVEPYLPPGVELDLFERRPVVSLVGFQFLNTRVLEIPWPGFRNFPEWNLRIYVNYRGRRGVCFVREYVPQRFVAWVARTFYNEPYAACPMTMHIDTDASSLTATYTAEVGGRIHTLSARGNRKTVLPATDSVEHFFKEHSWGYGTSKRGGLVRYEVRHPLWDVHPVEEYRVDVDWATLYGPQWRIMQEREPESVFLAAGSPITVFPKGTYPPSAKALEQRV